MIRSLDRGVGQVLEALRDNGLEDNTIVMFTSDNGGAHYIGIPEVNQPFRGWKISLFEGGIHVPFFIKWPGHLAPGTVVEAPVHHFDLYSTAAAAAGAPLPSDRVVDGVDLVPFATGERTGAPHESLFWRSGTSQTAIVNGWKLNYGEIALMWHGGCIIRSAFLGKISEAFAKKPDLDNLLLADYFIDTMSRCQAGWRTVISEAVKLGIPTPAFSTAITFYDGYRSARLPANLLQAQRDYFGAHTFERLSSPGTWEHANWTGSTGRVVSSTYNA